MLYQQVILTKEQAFCHLLLYFSLFEDETFEGEETYQVFSILKSYPFTSEVDFPGEVNLFFDYKNEITDTSAYFDYLIQLIASRVPLVLLFHAAQVALSDSIYSDKDKESLLLLSTALGIDEVKGNTILELATGQRLLK